MSRIFKEGMLSCWGFFVLFLMQFCVKWPGDVSSLDLNLVCSLKICRQKKKKISAINLFTYFPEESESEVSLILKIMGKNENKLSDFMLRRGKKGGIRH